MRNDMHRVDHRPFHHMNDSLLPMHTIPHRSRCRRFPSAFRPIRDAARFAVLFLLSILLLLAASAVLIVLVICIVGGRKIMLRKDGASP